MIIAMMKVLFITSLLGALGIVAHLISKMTYKIKSTPPTTIIAINDGFFHPLSAYVLSEKGRSRSDHPKPSRTRPMASIS